MVASPDQSRFGGNQSSPKLGLTTGQTWYGNTAYGPAGGYAAGYATQRGDGSYGNFKALNGAPMSGAYGQVTGPAPRVDAQGRPVKEVARMPGGWNPAGSSDWGGFQSALGSVLAAPAQGLRGLVGFGRGFFGL